MGSSCLVSLAFAGVGWCALITVIDRISCGGSREDMGKVLQDLSLGNFWKKKQDKMLKGKL